jgi:hypothetical protein
MDSRTGLENWRREISLVPCRNEAQTPWPFGLNIVTRGLLAAISSPLCLRSFDGNLQTVFLDFSSVLRVRTMARSG